MADVASFRLEGEEQLLAKIQEVINKTPRRIERSVYRRANRIITIAKQEYVPVEDSILKNSGFVDDPKTVAGMTTCRLGFGGASAPYAQAVHDHPSEHSPKSWKKAEASGVPVKFKPTGRGPKYLEKPFLNASSSFLSDLAQDLKL